MGSKFRNPRGFFINLPSSSSRRRGKQRREEAGGGSGVAGGEEDAGATNGGFPKLCRRTAHPSVGLAPSGGERRGSPPIGLGDGGDGGAIPAKERR